MRSATPIPILLRMRERPSSNEVWRRRNELVWRRIGEEAVVLDLEGKVLRGINETGWKIWELLDGHRSLGDIAGHLAGEYSIGEEEAERDAKAFLVELEAAGLVERS